MNIKKFGWICFGLTVLTNIIFYPFLPQKLAVQFSFTGAVNRSMAKPLALLLLPGILFLVNMIYSKDDTKSSRVVLVGIIIFIVNIVADIVNLLMFR